ncbi:hypothetical protein H5186_07950 [Pseudoalteromonas sp. SG41-2]|uniref:hypothetical protein n=1 Tax=Pseudoalteromonas sp. SG41-2 TaxID=2760978 RepID=UPI0015FED62C|nr:hypothetical protein [Pseudoalteromonas sp. SG41-2]MBB1479404.1 hypothetical protein [Pseudoalteromonas sp. SG41-2]
MILPNFKTCLIASMVAVLCACNSEIDDLVDKNAEQKDDHDHTEITAKGRLAISHADITNVSVFNADNNSLLETFNTSNVISGLYASPNFRYAVLIQRAENYVEFIDGGLFTEDHGDHQHGYEQQPELHDLIFSDSKPTHFDVSEQQAALFFDGDLDAGIPASFVLLSDESLAAGKTLAAHSFNNAMHGTAQIRGESVITTYRSEDITSVLPNYVEQLHIHGDHFHQEQRFAVDCPALHGSAQNHQHIAFGCSDGVLVITEKDNVFNAAKVANLNNFAEGTRIGTIKASEHSELFLGIAQSKLFYTIDPASAEMTQLAWQQNTENTVLASALDRITGEFYVLESDGFLSVLHAEDDWQVSARFKVLENPAGNYALAASAADDTLYISDANNQTVLSIDTHEQTTKTILNLDFIPNQITWLGIAAESKHEH